MSSSTERKNRQAARSEGSYMKDINAKREADKKKKQKIKWTVIGVVRVVYVFCCCSSMHCLFLS